MMYSYAVFCESGMAKRGHVIWAKLPGHMEKNICKKIYHIENK